MNDLEALEANVLSGKYTAKGLGQLWAVVLTTDAVEVGDGLHLKLSAAPRRVRDALNRAAAVVDHTRICVVTTPEHYRRFERQLWHLLRSNVIVQSGQRGTAHGVLMALLRILQRDAAARMVLLPSTHEVRHEIPLRRSLRDAAAHMDLRPQGVFILGDEGRAQRDTGILAGPAHAFLQLIERRLPDIVRQARAAVARDRYGREDAMAAADLDARLRGLDFHRDVLTGQESYLSVMPAPRRRNSGAAEVKSRADEGAQ